jgi:hypothetical protein
MIPDLVSHIYYICNWSKNLISYFSNHKIKKYNKIMSKSTLELACSNYSTPSVSSVVDLESQNDSNG